MGETARLFDRGAWAPHMDLSRFDGMDMPQVRAALESEGYESYPPGRHGGRVLRSPDGSHLIRLSAETELAENAARLFVSAKNRHFPVVYGHRTVSPAAHITVLEPLKTAKDIEGSCTIAGIARGCATFITGSRQSAVKNDGARGDHSGVHALLRLNTEFKAAADGLMELVAERLDEKGRTAWPLYHDSRRNMWFRDNGPADVPTVVFFESLVLTSRREKVRHQVDLYRAREAARP